MQPCTMDAEELIGELHESIILRNLSTVELRRFVKICEIQTCIPGERIVEQGAVGADLDLILRGSVDIVLKGAEGRDIVVNTVKAGDVIGEAAIFMDEPRTASAVCREKCIVASVSRDKLFPFCDANPKAGLKIFNVIYSLLKRLGTTSRDLAAEKESAVTSDELDRLVKSLPKSLEDMLSK